jgi:hypothetical protein
MRNPNVQQQNEATKERIRQLADRLRRDPLAHGWLICALQRASLPVEQGILVQLECVPEQEGDLFKGCWLTCESRFYSFEVLVPRLDEQDIEVERWEDVTAGTPIDAHLPGRGKSFGYLAREVLLEMTASGSR